MYGILSWIFNLFITFQYITALYRHLEKWQSYLKLIDTHPLHAEIALT